MKGGPISADVLLALETIVNRPLRGGFATN